MPDVEFTESPDMASTIEFFHRQLDAEFQGAKEFKDAHEKEAEELFTIIYFPTVLIVRDEEAEAAQQTLLSVLSEFDVRASGGYEQ